MQREKKKIWNRISGDCDGYNTWHACIMVVPEEYERKGQKKYLNNDGIFPPKCMVDHKAD